MSKYRSGHYRHQPVNDCRPHANSVRASLPNGHASIFPRIDPTTGIHPMYTSRTIRMRRSPVCRSTKRTCPSATSSSCSISGI